LVGNGEKEYWKDSSKDSREIQITHEFPLIRYLTIIAKRENKVSLKDPRGKRSPVRKGFRETTFGGTKIESASVPAKD